MQPSEAVARGVRPVVVTGMVLVLVLVLALVLVSDGGIMCAPCRGELACFLACRVRVLVL